MKLKSTCTQQGTRSDKNRDVTGSAKNADVSMFVIVDGTAKTGSGELANELVDFLVEGFIRTQISLDNAIADAERSVLDLLNLAHNGLCPKYPLGSASYLVLLVQGSSATTIHEGDCCLGTLNQDQRLKWETAPHCLANWKGDACHDYIAARSARERLFKCMSHRRDHAPSIQSLIVDPNTVWILATDGFLADLTASAQLSAIAELNFQGKPFDDDATFMLLIPETGNVGNH